MLNNLNNQKKDIKEKILLLNLDIEKINFEINSKQNDLISLKNLKIQINKSINFQTEILNNSKKRIIEISKEMETLPKNDNKNDKEQYAKNNLLKLKTKVELEENKIKDLNVQFNEEKNLVNKYEFEKTILEKEINEISSKINLNKSQIKEKIIHQEHDTEFQKLTNLVKIKKHDLNKINTEKKKIQKLLKI